MDGDYDTQTGEVDIRPGSIVAMPPQPQPIGERNLIFASPDCGEIFGALAGAQGAMGNPKKTKNAKVEGQTKSGKDYNYNYKYAPLEEVVDVIRAPMAEAGLIYRQFLAQRDGAWIMRTIIAHKSGQWYGCDYPIFVDRPGAQGFASGVTYSRRYGLMLALGLVGEDDDDANVADGNVATIASGGPGTQGSAGGARSAPQRQQAAPAPSAAKSEADKRFREIKDSIDRCVEIPELEGWIDSPPWRSCHDWIVQAKLDEGMVPEQTIATANSAMEQLRMRIEKRKALLADQAGLKDYEVG